MKKTHFASALILVTGLLLSSCTEVDLPGNTVSMRAFSNSNPGMAESFEPDLEINAVNEPVVTNKVIDSWSSSIFKVENGQAKTCDCDPDDFEINQIFLKETPTSEDHTFLFRNNRTTTESHLFNGKDVIGIDMLYKGEYVRMSDINVFDQNPKGKYAYSSELGVEVFYNESTQSKSAAYIFPIQSTEEVPEVSLSGLWMKIVVDFK